MLEADKVDWLPGIVLQESHGAVKVKANGVTHKEEKNPKLVAGLLSQPVEVAVA